MHYLAKQIRYLWEPCICLSVYSMHAGAIYSNNNCMPYRWSRGGYVGKAYAGPCMMGLNVNVSTLSSKSV